MDAKSVMKQCDDEVFSTDTLLHPGERLITAEQWPVIADELELTIREWEVIVLLFQGGHHDTIADQLCVAPGTVRKFIEQIHTKLQVNDRVELVLRIIECRDQLERNHAYA